MDKPYRFSCPRCERTDSLSWGASAWWNTELQLFELSDHLEDAHCEHCGDVEPVKIVIPDADDWSGAVCFEIAHVALIGFRDGSSSDWKTCGTMNAADEVQEGETLIRAAFGVYWRGDDDLAVHIEDFDELIDAQAFAAKIANGAPVDDWTEGDGAQSTERICSVASHASRGGA